jgi:hypothetical protein
MLEYFVTQPFRDVASHYRITKLLLFQQRQDMQTCRISAHQPMRKDACNGDVHDELGVLPIPKILQVLEVVHERFIVEILTLSQDYGLADTGNDLQLRY